MTKTIEFKLNGAPKTISVDGKRELLWVIRSELGLTGTKYGCGEGLCGSCTVLVNEEAVRSCITPMEFVQGKEVVTIEGLAGKKGLHPVQQAFVDHDALQCGYCTPGMILTAAAYLNNNPEPSRDDIVQALENNLCRCGAHKRILEAVQEAANQMKGGK